MVSGIKSGFTIRNNMALTQKERSAKLYKRRKENNLCPRCGKSLDRDGFYCTECLEKVRTYKRESRAFFRENNICTECGKKIVPVGQATCPECRAKRNNRIVPFSYDKKELYNQRFRKQQNSLYQMRIKEGICTRCGKRKPIAGKRKCGICLEKDAELHRNNRNNHFPVREYRRENHLCYFCGAKIDTNHKTTCSKCLLKFAENGKKYGGNNDYWEKDNRGVFGGNLSGKN